MTRSIDLFFRRACPDCAAVLALVMRQMRAQPAWHLRVFLRELDPEAFADRKVVICPATFIDGALCFYGTFSTEELAARLAAD